ncbi:MAG: HepT-like ribonuclease domain-containing protein [Gammaproteobacteria bacterium]
MKDDRLYLIHIGECIDRIEQYTAGGEADYKNSTLIQDAVIRNLQTLAESSQRVSDDLKAAHPDMPWRDIAGFRNVLVHQYLGVDLDYVWRVIEDDVPVLKIWITTALKELGVERR